MIDANAIIWPRPKTLFERMSEAQRLNPEPFALTTGDPQFDPTKPVTVNGFRFVPAGRADGTRSRLHRRVEAARSLAGDLADQGQPRMAQVIRDLCNSASASASTNSRLHRDLAEALSTSSTRDGRAPNKARPEKS